jgi:hypothetical protein
MLLLLAVTSSGNRQTILAVGSGLLLVPAFIIHRRSSRPLLLPSAVGLLVVGTAAVWLATRSSNDIIGPLFRAVMFLVLGLVMAGQALTDSGGPAVRRVRRLVRQLAQRQDFPEDLAACRLLPEVAELREAFRAEIRPALMLLTDSRPAVRLIILTALERYRGWKKGQYDYVIHLARKAPEPVIRAAALAALSDNDDRVTTDVLSELLRDPSRDVRRAAADAVITDSELRWATIREAVRLALSDPRLATDGPLLARAGFPAGAVSDMIGWATDPPPLGPRAITTLMSHFRRTLMAGSDRDKVAGLMSRIADPRSAAVLRIELTRLLIEFGLLSQDTLNQLVSADNPSPLRLLAAEALLRKGRDENAVAALRVIARQPNRELALAVAAVVQRLLHIDMGLALSEPLPSPHSRLAAEVTRRVMTWAVEGSAALASPPLRTAPISEPAGPRLDAPGADEPEGQDLRATWS